MNVNKALAKIEALKGIVARKSGDARELLQQRGAVPAPATPAIAVPVAMGCAAADAKLGGATIKHPASWLVAGIGIAGGLLGALTKHPTAAQASAAIGSGPASFLAGVWSYQKAGGTFDDAPATSGT